MASRQQVLQKPFALTPATLEPPTEPLCFASLQSCVVGLGIQSKRKYTVQQEETFYLEWRKAFLSVNEVCFV
jgi:hypothetical protein